MDLQRLNFRTMKAALINAKIEQDETPRFAADNKTVLPRIGVWPKRDNIPAQVITELENMKDQDGPSLKNAPVGIQMEQVISRVKPSDTSTGLAPIRTPIVEPIKNNQQQQQRGMKRKSEGGGGGGGQKKWKTGSTENKSDKPKMKTKDDIKLDHEAWQKLPFIKNCIVKLFRDLSKDDSVRIVKELVKTVVTPEHVDVRVPDNFVYVRCRDELSAATLANCVHFSGTAVVLTSVEEALYWQHVWNQFKEKRQRRRGKNRLKERIDKFAGVQGYADSFGNQILDYANLQPGPSSGPFQGPVNSPIMPSVAAAQNVVIGPQPRPKKPKVAELVDISDS
jgi:hypothetical protein